MNKLLTLPELLDTLQISRATAYRQMQRGKLRSIKIGGCLRFRPADVERFVMECRKKVA